MNPDRRKVLGILSASPILISRAEIAGDGPSNKSYESKMFNVSSDAITKETIAEAEKLIGVEYTSDERELILETINIQVQYVNSLHGVKFEYEDPGPALKFDPRPKDFEMPNEQWHIKRPDREIDLPDNDEDIAFAPLSCLSEWVRTRKISSYRLTEIYLQRIERYAPQLECMITVTPELARKQALQADREISEGQYRGPLHGIPYGAKDLLDTAGIRTTWGAAAHKNRVPSDDATVITLLNAAGAVLLGKTALGALANGNLWFGGLTRNPWNKEEGSEGSSSGSGAGVAAGLMAFAIGSETSGSIAGPASRNGTVGLTPTYGRVSRHGAMTLAWSMDKIGPLCRTAEDAILVLKELNYYDTQDPGSIKAPLSYKSDAPLKGLRVGYVPEWFSEASVSSPVRAILQLVDKMGLKLVKIRMPELPFDALGIILLCEAATAMQELSASGKDDLLRGQDRFFWPNIFRSIRFISAVDLLHAYRIRERLILAMNEIYKEVDMIISPTGKSPMLKTANYTGHPAITLPVGFIKTVARRDPQVSAKFYGGEPTGKMYRVPVSVTLFGQLFQEGLLCRVSTAIENALDVNKERPPLDP